MSAEEALSGQFEYRGMHTAPSSNQPGMHELDAHVGEDIYANPQHYMYAGDGHDEASMRVAHSVRGKPDAMVTVHRAGPPGIDKINPGDWVTPALSYAQQHGRHPTDPAQDGHIVSAQVRAGDLKWDGNDINEFGYHGSAPVSGKVRKPPKKGW